MTVSKPIDGWDRNAAKLLRLRILEGSPDKSVSYAPDAKYGQGPGPLTVQIDEILRRHASLWAHGMRQNPERSVQEGQASWRLEMREADAEIKRFVMSHKLGNGAAA